MNDARKHWNPWWFYNQVKAGGPWDYKQWNPVWDDFGISIMDRPAMRLVSRTESCCVALVPLNIRDFRAILALSGILWEFRRTAISPKIKI